MAYRMRLASATKAAVHAARCAGGAAWALLRRLCGAPKPEHAMGAHRRAWGRRYLGLALVLGLPTLLTQSRLGRGGRAGRCGRAVCRLPAPKGLGV